MKKKKYLLTRFGGIGDIAPVMVVGKQLRKQGHEVHMALREDDGGSKQIDLLKGTEACDTAMTFKEIGPWRTRCVSFEHGWVDIKSIYHKYDEVIDFMKIVEYNDTCNSSFITSPTDEWKKHRNSNFVNWYDLHLSWANIDPNSIPYDEKRPYFELDDNEKLESEAIKLGYSEVIVINPHASSLARTWYQAEELIPKLLEKYDNPKIFYWDNKRACWRVITGEGIQKHSTEIKSSLRASMCVLGAADIYIGADTGFTHIAEGMGLNHIAIYSSVPWWTRAKYYKHQIHIDKGFHTFSLTLGDPNRIKEGFDGLSKKEKKVLQLHDSGMPIEAAAKELNTTPEGVSMELQSIKVKIDSFERVQSKSLSLVSVDEVMDKIEQALKYEVEV